MSSYVKEILFKPSPYLGTPARCRILHSGAGKGSQGKTCSSITVYFFYKWYSFGENSESGLCSTFTTKSVVDIDFIS